MKKVVIVLFIVCCIMGVLFYRFLHGVSTTIFLPQGKNALGPNASVQQRLDEKTPINILLIGYGGGNHDGTYLTDSMMVAHIDPKTEKAFLVSLPRDTWVNIPTEGKEGHFAKINTAYEIGLDDVNYPNKLPQFTGPNGGMKMAGYVVTQVTGIPIHYGIGIDFDGFKKTIDAMGGVDIMVEKTFDDYEYPIAGKEDDLCGQPESVLPTLEAQATNSAVETIFPCRYEHLHYDKGLQHMSGDQALAYVRSRHSLQDGTDFGRARRQQNLLVAVKKKVLSAGILPRVIPFITSLQGDFKTDLTPDDIRVLIQHASDLSKYPITSLALTDQNFLVNAMSANGQSVLEPKAGIDNWKAVHTWLSNEFAGIPTPVMAKVKVENGTKTYGLAQTATSNLANLGMDVVTPQTHDTQDVSHTTITLFVPAITAEDMAHLKKEFGQKVIIKKQVGAQKEYNVVVVVGNDYAKLKGAKEKN